MKLETIRQEECSPGMPTTGHQKLDEPPYVTARLIDCGKYRRPDRVCHLRKSIYLQMINVQQKEMWYISNQWCRHVWMCECVSANRNKTAALQCQGKRETNAMEQPAFMQNHTGPRCGSMKQLTRLCPALDPAIQRKTSNQTKNHRSS